MVLRHQLKFSLLDMFDPMPPSFLLSYEQAIAKDFSILAEGGPSTSYNSDKLRGYKLRGELRWYAKTFDSGDRFYLGLQGRLKNYSRYKTGTFCRDDCNYFQTLEHQLHSRIWTANFLLGSSFLLGGNFVMDLGGTLGWRWAERKTKGIPQDATLIGNGSAGFIDLERIGTFSTLSMGVILRLGLGW